MSPFHGIKVQLYLLSSRQGERCTTQPYQSYTNYAISEWSWDLLSPNGDSGVRLYSFHAERGNIHGLRLTAIQQ